MKFPEHFYEHLRTVNYTEIKGGIQRHTFLEIWVIQVEGRVFARSWNKSEKSWFTAFITDGVGELKYGNEILKVSGKKVSAMDPIHERINESYMQRYGNGDNLYYAKGISQPEYHNFTLEFFIE